MNEKKTQNILRNQNLINNANKERLKLQSINNNYKIKNKSIFSSNNNSNKSYHYYKIIINNIKKYNLDKHKFNKSIINNIIIHRHIHYISLLNDKIIINDKSEYLKRYYFIKEIIKKLPKFYLYYKNYFIFFLKPTLSDFSFHDLLRKTFGKQADIFYNNKLKNFKNNFKSIFNKNKKNENSKGNSAIKDIKNKSKKFLEIKENSLSTLIFSYESLNNSKNIDKAKEISFASFSFEKIKNLERNEKKNNINNKVNLFLNLDDNNKHKKIESKKGKDFNIFIKSKDYNKEILLKNSRNKNNEKNFLNLYTKNETEIIKTNSKNNITSRNINNKHRINFKYLFYTKDQKDDNNNYLNFYRNNSTSNGLKTKNCQVREIINLNENKRMNNYLSSLNIKRQNQFYIINKSKDKQSIKLGINNNSSTQITKIKKKTYFSRNINNDLAQTNKITSHGKGTFLLNSRLNLMNKNNNLYCLSKIYNLKSNINPINYENKNNIKSMYKNKSHSSTVEDKKSKLNQILKDLENLKSRRYNNKRELKILEYSNK